MPPRCLALRWAQKHLTLGGNAPDAAASRREEGSQLLLDWRNKNPGRAKTPSGGLSVLDHPRVWEPTNARLRPSLMSDRGHTASRCCAERRGDTNMAASMSLASMQMETMVNDAEAAKAKVGLFRRSRTRRPAPALLCPLKHYMPLHPNGLTGEESRVSRGHA